MQDAVLCMDLVFGSDRVVRLAARDCTTSSSTGHVYSYRGSLQANARDRHQRPRATPATQDTLQVAIPSWWTWPPWWPRGPCWLAWLR